MNILVVDRTQAIVYRIKKILKDFDVNIHNSYTESNSINKVIELNSKLDIAIVDLNLGAEDGFSIIKKIQFVNSKTKILILTSQNKRESFAMAMRIGVVDYILKPFDDKYLKKRLIHHIKMLNSSETNFSKISQNNMKVNSSLTNEIQYAFSNNTELNLIAIVFTRDTDYYSEKITNEEGVIYSKYPRYLSENWTKDIRMERLENDSFMILVRNSNLSEKKKIEVNLSFITSSFLKINRISSFSYVICAINVPNEVSANDDILRSLMSLTEQSIIGKDS